MSQHMSCPSAATQLVTDVAGGSLRAQLPRADLTMAFAAQQMPSSEKEGAEGESFHPAHDQKPSTKLGQKERLYQLDHFQAAL